VEFGVDGFHQLAHGSLDLGLENLLARQEPVAIVVALEAAEEFECIGRETREHDGCLL
jgi:hypothetical protein